MKKCVACGTDFETRSSDRRSHRRRFCDVCRIDAHHIKWSFTCLNCCKPSVRISEKKPKFCTKSCASQYQHAHQTTVPNWDRRSNFQRWVDAYGLEEAQRRDELYRKNMSQAITLADMSYQKKVAAQLLARRNSQHKGKTVEEIYGLEKGNLIRKKRSELTRGERNPAYGKTYLNGGRSVKGYYKGHFFRSLLEYSFMKHLESQGVSLDTVIHEPRHVPYVIEGRSRTYTPDFEVENCAYEVKPSYILHSEKLRQREEVKWKAAREYYDNKGMQFSVVSEDDFSKISFDVASTDGDVIFIESTLDYFKG